MILDQIGPSGQKKLANGHVLVIGAGGLGSPLLNYLACAGVGNITIYDHDTIDLSNLHRQILFSSDDIGKNKALVASKKLAKINPFINVKGVSKRFDTSIDINPFDIIIDCTDSLRAKFNAHDMCFKFKKKFIMASIHKFEGQIQSFDFSMKNIDAPCMRCLWEKVPSSSGIQTCEDVGILGAAVGVIGVMQALEVLKTILQLEKLSNEQNLIVNLFDFSTYKLKIKKNTDCVLCSNPSQNIIDPDSELEISYQEVLENNFITVCLTQETSKSYDILTSIDLVMKDIKHLNKDQKIALICNKGITSLSAAKLLRENNYTNAFSLKDGLSSLL